MVPCLFDLLNMRGTIYPNTPYNAKPPISLSNISDRYGLTFFHTRLFIHLKAPLHRGLFVLEHQCLLTLFNTLSFLHIRVMAPALP